jgi:aspartyl-tRNA(Asn)/glutamyl-tRNA(Gln) amidotransferase subunit B
VEKPLEHAIYRQYEPMLEGGGVVQETRLWDTSKNRTFSMGGKEEAHDYRYFPDPDLLPLVIDAEWIERIRGELPELPDQRKQRFVDQYGLPAYDAEILTAERELADFFEAVLDTFDQPKPVSNWIMGPLLGRLRAQGKTAADIPVSAEALARLLMLVHKGEISSSIAKTVFDEMADTAKMPETIVAEKGLRQVSDTGAIEATVQKILDAHPDEAAAYRGGKTKLLGFFVGQVMRETKGKANPQVVNQVLRELLEKE